MIVKILSAAASFEGVSYNTDKIEKDKGDLMKVSGFGPLQCINGLKPEDYVNYLKAVSAQNKRIRQPQLHVVISAKGKSHTAEALTSIATDWLKEMGYGKQPYLIVHHKDTGNSHVHIVSTRVDKAGKKISSAFEKIRAVQKLAKVMGMDAGVRADADLKKALGYNFSTKAQFMMILESMGYVLKESESKLQLIKFGSVQTEVALGLVLQRKSEYVLNQKRAVQLTAIIHRYRLIHSPELRREMIPLPGGLEKASDVLTSDLAIYLKEKFGVLLLFHSKGSKPAYGFTVIDHDKGNVFKGGELMDLQELIAVNNGLLEMKSEVSPSEEMQGSARDFRSKLEANFPDQYLLNRIDSPLSLDGSFSPEVGFKPYEPKIDISISDDIDDEAIHGRNRNRKKQARTNTR